MHIPILQDERGCKASFFNGLMHINTLLVSMKTDGLEHLFAMLRLLWYTVIVKNGG